MTILTSSVTWTLIGTFIFGGLGAITGLVSPQIAGIITIVLNILGVLLHRNQIAVGKIR